MSRNFVLKGNICYTPDPAVLCTVESGYLVCEDGRCSGVFRELPERYSGLKIRDCGENLIIPGLVDLHLHAPQYAFRGLGMDLELLDWLNERAFQEEAKYADPRYAQKAYSIFADDMKQQATTRACIFATLHREGTEILMDQMEKTGLVSFVGKVSMDRNAPDTLREDTREALDEVSAWLLDIQGRYLRTKPMITPRFTPCCSDELMEGLGKIRQDHDLPVQSHLSENRAEIRWVSRLCPWSEFYGDAYDRFGLFGGDAKTVMAHCVWSKDQEIERIKERGVFIAHCPESNMNISSGIAPIRKYLDSGLRVGLGSDVAGGSSPSIFRAMVQAVQVSKIYWRMVDQDQKPLTMTEAFYLATKGGGAFFGKVGSFEKGYEFDAVVLDDSAFRHPQELTVKERLERLIYLTDEPKITAKFVAGNQITG